MRTFLRRFPDGPLHAGIVLALGVVLAFAPDHFLPMLVRAFLLQWLLFFGVLAALGTWQRRWWLTGASAGAALLVVMPAVPARTVPIGTAADAELRIAHLNVFQPNDAFAEVLQAARATDADVLSFQEVDERWAQALVQGLGADYPYHRIAPRGNCYGIALFSRRPFEHADVLYLTERPVIDATVRTEAGPVRVLAVHASSPGSYREFRDRNRQLDRLAEVVGASDRPVAVVGDLNTVSWDHALRRLCASTGLRESADAPSATWPSIAGLALIPLDHVLATPALDILAPRSFPIPGSDHRGLVAGLRLHR